jgi:hypothetical protein
MDKKKPVDINELVALPSMRLALGDIHSPDIDVRTFTGGTGAGNQPNRQMFKSAIDIEGAVKRIIARLEED